MGSAFLCETMLISLGTFTTYLTDTEYNLTSTSPFCNFCMIIQKYSKSSEMADFVTKRKTAICEISHFRGHFKEMITTIVWGISMLFMRADVQVPTTIFEVSI